MRADHRWLVVLAGNLVFLFLVGQVNHYLSSTPLLGLARGQVYLFMLGLPLAFIALRLNLVPGVAATVVTALAFESLVPLPPGVLMIAATACVSVTFALRAHFNRFESSTGLFVAVLINLVLLLTVTAAMAGHGVSLTRVVIDLLLSQLALTALTGWFFAAQTALLALFGYQLDTELREPI